MFDTDRKIFRKRVNYFKITSKYRLIYIYIYIQNVIPQFIVTISLLFAVSLKTFVQYLTGKTFYFLKLQCNTTFSALEEKSYFITRKRYNIFTCKNTIFLHTKILVLPSNEKPRTITLEDKFHISARICITLCIKVVTT